MKHYFGELKVDYTKRSLWLAQANSCKYIDNNSYAKVVTDGRAVVQTSTTSLNKANTCNKSKRFLSEKCKSTIKQDTYCSNRGCRRMNKQICPSPFQGQLSPVRLTNWFQALQDTTQMQCIDRYRSTLYCYRSQIQGQ